MLASTIRDMAKETANVQQLKRMWVKVTPAAHKELLHLAIDLDATIEKLAGEILTEGIRRRREAFDAALPADPKKPKR